MNTIRLIDLFCGIGGFRLGLEKSGQNRQVANAKGLFPKGRQPNSSNPNRRRTPALNCVWSNDNDRYACQIYRKHFGEVCEQDIRAVDIDAIPEHDLLCAGFPCQSFSIAGKRKGFEDTRGTLFFEICRVLRAKRPSYVFLENVKGLLSHDDGSTFRTILSSLDELGYDCQWQVLNSKDFGVPQNRERVFIIGHTRGQPRPKVFPLGEDGGMDKQTQRENGETVPCLEGTGYKGISLERFYGVLDAYNARETDMPTSLRQNMGNSGALLMANALDADGYLRFGARPRDEDGKPQLLPIGYRRIRRLTPLECERLQGFPDGWTEGISDTQRYKCLGNAVTVNVIEAIGKQLMKF